MESVVEQKLWEDKEIKFDSPSPQNHLRNGEILLDTIYHIEDSKGYPGDSGRLLATNLRIIWYSLVHKKFNLSIGYGTIAKPEIRMVPNKAHSTSQALFILAVSGSGGSTRFEFLFTDISSETARKSQPIFSSIFEIFHLYQRTYLYRELKIRGAILQYGQLIMLPQEQVYNKVNGVMNLSSDQGNLGNFVVTNIRLVWYADANETFNMSLPYLQIANIRVRESKYGLALVVQTSESSGGYVLGFRIDPTERLNDIYKELISLHTIYSANPNFGVVYNSAEAQKRNAAAAEMASKEFKVDNFNEIDERQEREINSKLNTYLAEGGALAANTNRQGREPVYCKELGFAMERIRDGYKLQDLWDVLPASMADD